MLKKTYAMDLTQQTAAAYYNKHRKRSFFLSRIIVGVSMFVLVVALAVNIANLSSQDNSTTQSHASTPQNIQKLLPSLPAGCLYKQTPHGLIVICPTPTPQQKITVPVTIALPKLPPQCQFTTTSGGVAILCAPSHAPIPTVPIQLPPNCTASSNTSSISCTDANNKTVTFSLPTLPNGCNYQKQGSNYFVVCEAKQ